MSVTFNTLKKEATLFSELTKNPVWWNRFKAEEDLYIEVRKDNQVNVYFEGGSVARIHLNTTLLKSPSHETLC